MTGGNARPTQPQPPVPRLLQAEEGRAKTENLDEKIHYVTEGGLHMLYDPEALDKWISNPPTRGDTWMPRRGDPHSRR